MAVLDIWNLRLPLKKFDPRHTLFRGRVGGTNAEKTMYRSFGGFILLGFN